MFNLIAEHSDGPAELILSKIGKVLSGVLILPKFAKVNRCEEEDVCNSCSRTARGCCEADLNCSGC